MRAKARVARNRDAWLSVSTMVFVVHCLGGTLVACLPALLVVACLHLAGIDTGISVSLLIAACAVVGVLHAWRRHQDVAVSVGRAMTGCANRVEAAAYAYRLGIATP